MDLRNADVPVGRTRSSRAGKVSLSAKKATPKSRRFSSPPMSAKSDRSDVFSPTALMALPSKKLSFGGHDLLDDVKLDPSCGLITGTTQAEPIQVHLRVRPFTAIEKKADASIKPVVTLVGDDTVLVEPPEGARTNERQGTYKFSRVHGPDTQQTQFYDDVLKPVVDNAVLNGKNGLLFAYGMTNAGKTFTVLGSDDNPGLLIRAVDDCVRMVTEANTARPAPRLDEPASLFNKPSTSSTALVPDLDSAESDITDDMLAKPSAGNKPDQDTTSIDGNKLPPLRPGESFALSMSCLEVYNEQVYDLLTAVTELGAARPILKIKDGISGRVYVQGLRHVDVKTHDDCVRVIQEAIRNRKVAETGLNCDSSRSHCVFGVHIWKVWDYDDRQSLSHTMTSMSQTMPSHRLTNASLSSTATGVLTSNPAPRRALWSKLSIVDLAGSERQRRTANRGVRLKEAGCINNSLMSLMHCLETIRWNQKHAGVTGGVSRLVPFRETKLTRLFQDNLAGAGAGYTVMVLNIGPSPNDFDETVHALKYGALAKEIKIAPPKVDTRWAVGTQVAEAFKKRRAVMSLIDEDAELPDENSGDSLPSNADGYANAYGKWQQERAELLSQIDDLQALNAALRADLRQAIERNVTIEIEVREEVSNEMAERMRDTESRMRDMFAKSAEERVKKLEDMYKMRMTSSGHRRTRSTSSHTRRSTRNNASINTASLRMTGGALSPVAASPGSHSGDSEDELVLQVVECEDEMTRMRNKHTKERSQMIDEIAELKGKLLTAEAETDAKISGVKSEYNNKLAAMSVETESLRTQLQQLQHQLSQQSQPQSQSSEDNFVEVPVEFIEEKPAAKKRGSGTRGRKNSKEGTTSTSQRKKSTGKYASNTVVPVTTIDLAEDNHEVENDENAEALINGIQTISTGDDNLFQTVSAAVAAVETKVKRTRASKRRASEEHQVTDTVIVDLGSSDAPNPTVTTLPSQPGILQSVLSTAATRMGNRLKNGVLSVLMGNTISESAPMNDCSVPVTETVTGDNEPQRIVRYKTRRTSRE